MFRYGGHPRVTVVSVLLSREDVVRPVLAHRITVMEVVAHGVTGEHEIPAGK
jgi:hypothetical protein